MMLPDGVRVEAQVLWGSIGWATPAAFGVALADPGRRTILITGEGSRRRCPIAACAQRQRRVVEATAGHLSLKIISHSSDGCVIATAPTN
jgi:TPP-dependent 2-oxoacid decarboxylase